MCRLAYFALMLLWLEMPTSSEIIVLILCGRLIEEKFCSVMQHVFLTISTALGLCVLLSVFLSHYESSVLNQKL
jgi:hypothetical protein